MENISRNIIIFSDEIFDKSLDEQGFYRGFPNEAEIVYEIIALCKKHNVKWSYEN